jgi:hypothetical protein
LAKESLDGGVYSGMAAASNVDVCSLTCDRAMCRLRDAAGDFNDYFWPVQFLDARWEEGMLLVRNGRQAAPGVRRLDAESPGAK